MPSRVRSPTPEKTETPPCCFAMLLISSWISTVLPTPAPPKRPILPPRTYGAIRSTTLMPVSKISIFDESSSNGGGSRWIGQRSLPAGGASLPSTGVAEDVPDAAERHVADRHRDRRPRVDHVGAAGDAVGRVHRDSAHPVVAEMLLHLRDQLAAVGPRDPQRRVDLGQSVREDGVDDDALDLDQLSDVLVGHGSPVTLRPDALTGGTLTRSRTVRTPAAGGQNRTRLPPPGHPKSIEARAGRTREATRSRRRRPSARRACARERSAAARRRSGSRAS